MGPRPVRGRRSARSFAGRPRLYHRAQHPANARSQGLRAPYGRRPRPPLRSQGAAAGRAQERPEASDGQALQGLVRAAVHPSGRGREAHPATDRAHARAACRARQEQGIADMMRWMIYVIVVTLILCLAALNAERALRWRRAPTRWVWIVAIVSS